MSIYSERWLKQAEASLKASTVASYRQHLRVHLLPAFGQTRVRQLHRGAIMALLAEKLASGLTPETVGVFWRS